MARKQLNFNEWKAEDIGSDRIARSVIKAIEIPDNNLVNWDLRYGEKKREHNNLYIALEQPSQIGKYEQVFYNIYHGENDSEAFNGIVKLFGKKYRLPAYLFFLKDHSKYMPISPDYFDTAFEKLGVIFSTSGKCSWENYMQYNLLLEQIRERLARNLEGNPTLLDAHSFAWMISSKKIYLETDTQLKEYDQLQQKEKDAVTKARIGQGRFRQQLLTYWGRCAATPCRDHSLLFASHIKPWSECNTREAIDPFNGLLLSPSLDAAFDQGYISFDDSGKILISHMLKASDAKVLGIDKTMRLRKLDKRHCLFLDYHRKYIFKKN